MQANRLIEPALAAHQRGREFRSQRGVRTGLNRMIALSLFVVASCGAGITDALTGTSGMFVQTEDELAASGPAGGPFLPASIDYDISNIGTAPMTWTVSANQPWLDIAPTNGVLDSLQSESVAVTFSTSVASMQPGLYTATLSFVNQTAGIGNTTRQVRLTVEDDGWTVFTASPDTRRVYVSSSSGSDANDGLSQTSAKQTIAAGISLIRDGYPDWLLLKCGDTWNTGIGNWQTRGRSATEPQLVSSYGTGARPLVSSGGSEAMGLYGNVPCGNFAVHNIHFRGREGAPLSSPTGLRFLAAGPNILIEGCLIEGYATGLVIQEFQMPGPFTNVRIRRNVVTNNYSVGTDHAQGAYFSGIHGLLIEENTFHQNGWSPTAPAATPPTMFRHNIYIQNTCETVTTRRNFVLYAGATGISQRRAGTVEDNVVMHCPISIYNGNGGTAITRNNIIYGGRNIDPNQPRGWAIDCNGAEALEAQGNIIYGNTAGTSPAGIQVGAGSATSTPTRISLVDNIIHEWGSGLAVYGPSGMVQDLRIIGNDVQESSRQIHVVILSDAATSSRISASGMNRFSSAASPSVHFSIGGVAHHLQHWRVIANDTTSATLNASYPDPDRTPARYQAHLGLTASEAAFIQALLHQQPNSWDHRYTTASYSTWVRAGFGR